MFAAVQMYSSFRNLNIFTLRGGGINIFASRGGQTFYVRGSGAHDDVVEEIDVS